MKYFLGCFVSALLGLLVAIWIAEPDGSRLAQADEPIDSRGPALRKPGTTADSISFPANAFNAEGLTPEEAVNVVVYERMNKSVVNITTQIPRGDSLFFIDVPDEGAGSGSVIDRNGHILTNYHVIEDARHVSVTLHDGKSYDATFVGADAVNDIAIIKVDAPREILFPVIFGDSSRLRVGMRVFALGNPFGLERTLTTGIISSLNRSLQIRSNRSIKSIIQIDAAINPGNSGGPLLDSHGRLIGMNTAIASKTGQSSGVGFAIPVNLISRVVQQLITHGRVIRPEIGIQKVYETEQGLLVARVTPNGPAKQAGIRGPKVDRRRRGPFVIERIDRSAADLIVAVDGKAAKSADDFLEIIERKKPGDSVVLTVFRDGRRVDVSVRLGGESGSRN